MTVAFHGGLLAFIARLKRTPADDSDADLLERFVHKADEAAFTAILERHGPMVLSVCQRRLGHEADAEDAFQAVFLCWPARLGRSADGNRCPVGSIAWLT